MSTFPKEQPTHVLDTIDDVRDALANTDWIKETPTPITADQEKNLQAAGIKARPTTSHRFTTKSLWLISLIDELAGPTNPDRTVYNSEIKAEAHKRLFGTTLTHADAAKEGDALSALVYNAQCYRHSDRLTQQGYVPLTQELIDRTGEGGFIEPHQPKLFTIVVNGNDATDTTPDRYPIKNINGKLYAVKPKHRNKVLAAHGQPVKAIPKPAPKPKKATK